MLIEFIGGKMDGEVGDVPFMYSSIKIPYRVPSQVCAYMQSELSDVPKVAYLLYHRKFPTNKFYFDKIEEV